MIKKKLLLRAALLSLIPFLLCSCAKKRKIEDMQGFWVSTDYLTDKSFYTLNIKDSVIETNTYGIYNCEYPYWEENEKGWIEVLYPFDSFGLAFKLLMNDDTLLQVRDYETPDTIRYVRNDSLTNYRNYRKLLFSDSPLRIVLPDAERNHGLTLRSKSLATPLYIGRLKRGNTSTYPKITPDSTLIQVDDAFIDPAEIPVYLHAKQMELEESEREKLMTLLYADEETPQKLIDIVENIIKSYSANLTVLRGYVDWTDGAAEFCYEVI